MISQHQESWAGLVFIYQKKPKTKQELIRETRKGPAFHYYYINIIIILRHPQIQAKPECRVKRCPFSTKRTVTTETRATV